MNTQTVILDVTKPSAIPQVVTLGQGDANGTTLVANIYDNGEALTLTGYSVKLCIQTPNGAGYYECDGTVSGNAATFSIDETYAGTVAGVSEIAYVEVIDGDTVVCSTNRFTVVVLKSAQESADPSGAYNNGILQAIEDANDAAEAANSAADDANDAADTAQEIIDQFDGEYYASPNLRGNEPSESTFIEKVTECNGTSAEIQSIKGDTVVWNQLVKNGNFAENSGWQGGSGVTVSISGNKLTATGTTSSYLATYLTNANQFSCVSGHKYLIAATVSCSSGKVWILPTGLSAGGTISSTTATTEQRIGGIITAPSSETYNMSVRFQTTTSGTSEAVTGTLRDYVCIDLTQMFGAGNEPTAAEFERLFPDSYYPYDAGSLLSVNMQGVRTTGYNQFNKSSYPSIVGYISSGKIVSSSSGRLVTYIPCMPNTTYCATRKAVTTSERFIIGYTKELPQVGSNIYGEQSANTSQTVGNTMTVTTTTSGDAKYIVVWVYWSDTTSAVDSLCINISDPSRNGEYEPYWSSELSIPASDYFPNGMRSAGTVRDELTKSEAITRIGVQTLSVASVTTNYSNIVYARVAKLSDAESYGKTTGTANLQVIGFTPATSPGSSWDSSSHVGKVFAGANANQYWFGMELDTTQAQAESALNGKLLYYELATPTTTAIDPPLNLTYKVESGGTESIIKPSGTEPTSAAPTIVTFYAYSAEGLRDKALSVVAAIENGKASTNYAVGSYLIHKGTLYKVTSAIASGEEITPSTNVTATTVMAELIALTA